VADRILRKATAEWWLQNFLLGIDEHSLLYLAIRLERFYMSMDELQVLENLTSLNPGPTYAQSDTGLEFIGHDVSGYSRKAAQARPRSSHGCRGRTVMPDRSTSVQGRVSQSRVLKNRGQGSRLG